MPVRFKACREPPRGCGESKLITSDPSTSGFWKDPKEPDGYMRYCTACVQRGRRERAERRANGEIVPTVTEERRQQMSENAKKLHAEGRLGGSDYGRLGHRARKAKVVDAVLEHFRESGKLQLIIDAYESNLRSRNRPARLKAAEALVAMEFNEDKRMREARGAGKSPDEMTPDELQEFVEQGLAAMIESGEIPADITLSPDAVREIA
jgi:hypothetical protein